MAVHEHKKSNVDIINKLGLHARASAKLTQVASDFPCEVWLSYRNRRVNAKSIMGVMMLAASNGSTLEIETIGEHSDKAMDALQDLIANRFGEGE